MRDSAKKKLYSIIGTDLGSKALTIHTALKVMAKLGSVTHYAKPTKKPGVMKKSNIEKA